LREAARNLGVIEQTLFNWVKPHRQGELRQWDECGCDGGADGNPAFTGGADAEISDLTFAISIMNALNRLAIHMRR